MPAPTDEWGCNVQPPSEETGMSIDSIGPSAAVLEENSVRCAAAALEPSQRVDLAVKVLANSRTVSATAQEHAVSRKFVSQQVSKAKQALEGAFSPRWGLRRRRPLHDSRHEEVVAPVRCRPRPDLP